MNLRLRTAAARAAGVEEHICELQLGLAALAELKVAARKAARRPAVGDRRQPCMAWFDAGERFETTARSNRAMVWVRSVAVGDMVW